MSWGAGEWWALALPVVALGLVMALLGLWHRRRVRRAFAGELAERVLPWSVRVRRGARDVLVLLGLLAGVAALAEPLLGVEIQEIQRRGVDLVLVVDLSRSMDAGDVAPSRLARARREIHDLAEVLQDDRVGIVAFAGGVMWRLPLTRDRAALLEVADTLDTSFFQAQGSEIGAALREAGRLLDSHHQESGQAVILLSDGEAHTPDDALAAARELAELDVRLYTVLIGREAAPIPVGSGQFLRDEEGRTVLTSPGPAVLADLARAGHGTAIRSTPAAEDMHDLYAELRSVLEVGEGGVVRREIPRSGFQWPLGLAVAALLGAAWLGDGRRPWGAAAALLLAVLAAPRPALAGPLADVDALYRAEDYAGAASAFEDLVVERPGDVGLWSRLAAARFRAGDYDGAARAYDFAAGLGGRADDVFGAGNAHWLAGRLEEALRRYDAVLAAQPGHEAAAHNREILLAELEARRQQPPPQDGQEGQQDGQEGQQDGQEGQQDGQEGQQDGQEGQQDGQEGQQDGQEGQQDGQEGQQDGQEGQQDGQESQGQPQAGQESQGQPQDGQEGRPQAGQPQDGQAQPGSGEPGDTGLAEPVSLDDLEGPGTDGEAVGAVTGEEDEGEGQPVEAPEVHDAREYLEQAEEGHPSLVVPGRSGGGKEW